MITVIQLLLLLQLIFPICQRTDLAPTLKGEERCPKSLKATFGHFADAKGYEPFRPYFVTSIISKELVFSPSSL